MLEGRATADGTRTYAAQYPSIEFRPLGPNGLQVSPAGFGCYRVDWGVSLHSAAMAKALRNGINLIDTSTNYADGGSERLVGDVLHAVNQDHGIGRDQVVVVSKVGYLQGQNYARSQQRKEQGRAFPDLVPYSQGLEHCIHPVFIADQLERSLERLQLETIDVLLLHNPEYYLGWAAKQGMPIDEAQDRFYGRIKGAIEYLESQVAAGRIQAYGISANTFPSPSEHDQFVSLERVWKCARSIGRGHHFQVIQMPMNLFETGAVTESNQSDDGSVLDAAAEMGLGVLINRPLNAIVNNQLVRLAEVQPIDFHSDDEIIKAITALNASEKTLWRKVLPELGLPGPLYQRVKDQAAVGDQLKHFWRNFGSHARWRQFTDGFLWPHLMGVFEFLKPHASQSEAVAQWLSVHPKRLSTAVQAVGSLYVGEAVRRVKKIKDSIRHADVHWDIEAALSQLALRALRSTTGVTTVLVGMRQEEYVDDVLQELQRNVTVESRTEAWRRLSRFNSTGEMTD